MTALYKRAVEVRWEILPDEEAAAVREADLIIALRPPFNASISNEGRWNYIVVSWPSGKGLTRFELSTQPQGGRVYGCFPHLGRGVS